jgi:hypothetical protein
MSHAFREALFLVVFQAVVGWIFICDFSVSHEDLYFMVGASVGSMLVYWPLIAWSEKDQGEKTHESS